MCVFLPVLVLDFLDLELLCGGLVAAWLVKAGLWWLVKGEQEVWLVAMVTNAPL
jgi:hypothetical protein